MKYAILTNGNFYIVFIMGLFLQVYTPNLVLWIVAQIAIILFIHIFIYYAPNHKWAILIELAFEKIYNFFSEIISNQKKWVQIYVISLFFLILFSNLSSVVIDFIVPVFWIGEKNTFILWGLIQAPSTLLSFNIAMAIVSICIVIIVQFLWLGLKNFFYNYLPIFWKKYITFERGKMPLLLYYPVFLITKVFDICISFFLVFLDIIWYWAKIVSLSLRLFWNMTSWGTLLVMTFAFMSFLTMPVFWMNFPIIIPLVIYAQALLVAFIQAFVFSLLIAVFIKVSESG